MMKHYYVSSIDGQSKALVSGPYQTHQGALDDVERIKAKVYGLDPRSHFYAWGTAGVEGNDPPLGVLQRQGFEDEVGTTDGK